MSRYIQLKDVNSALIGDDMADVMEVLSQAISLPVEELKLRSSGTDADVDALLKELTEKGLVEIKHVTLKGLSAALGQVEVAELTSKGFKAAVR